MDVSLSVRCQISSCPRTRRPPHIRPSSSYADIHISSTIFAPPRSWVSKKRLGQMASPPKLMSPQGPSDQNGCAPRQALFNHKLDAFGQASRCSHSHVRPSAHRGIKLRGIDEPVDKPPIQGSLCSDLRARHQQHLGTTHSD